MAKRPFHRMGKGAVGLAEFGFKLVFDQLQSLDHVDDHRLQPIHRPRRKGDLVAVGRHFHPVQDLGRTLKIRPPPFNAGVVLPIRHPEPGGVIGFERLQQRRRSVAWQNSADQHVAPVVAIVAVRAFLGVDLADRLIAIQPAGVDQMQEGIDVAAMVAHLEHLRAGEIRLDLAGKVGSAGQIAVLGLDGHGGVQIEAELQLAQDGGEFGPEFVIIEVDHDGLRGGGGGPCAQDRAAQRGAGFNFGHMGGQAVFLPPDLDVMQQRRQPGMGHIGVVGQVSLRRKFGVGVEPGLFATGQIMAFGQPAVQAVHPRVGGEVKGAVEQPGPLDLADLQQFPGADEQQPQRLQHILFHTRPHSFAMTRA